jgi:hypothetical protein
MSDRYEQQVIETMAEGEHTMFKVWAEFPQADFGPPEVVAVCESCDWQARSVNTVGVVHLALAHTQEFHV